MTAAAVERSPAARRTALPEHQIFARLRIERERNRTGTREGWGSARFPDAGLWWEVPATRLRVASALSETPP
jgi:hypothetical protein